MWPNPQFLVDLDTFTEGLLNGNLHFLCSESYGQVNTFNVRIENIIYKSGS